MDDLDILLEEYNKPVPWYTNLYNFLVYRVPFKLQCAYWWAEAFIQRGRRGYSDSDWWNFNIYLATVISGAMDRFANEGHGYPPGMTDQGWSDILVKIKHACDRVMYLESEGQYPNEQDREQIREAFKLIGENFWWLWD